MNPYEEVLLETGYMVWRLNDGIIQVPTVDAVKWWNWELDPPRFDSDISGEPTSTSIIIFPDGRLHLIDASDEEYAVLLPELQIGEAANLTAFLEKLSRAVGDESVSCEEASEIVRKLLP